MAALAHETNGDAHVRELTRRSLKSLINQFREEISRFTAGTGAQRAPDDRGLAISDDGNDQRLTNTRAKRRLLEEARVKLQQQPSGNARVDKLSLDSLQSQIKQLKEEIVLCQIRASDGKQPSLA